MQMGKKIFIIYPGRFHPFHKGHKSVYDYLSTKYGGNDVYITTTDKVELPKSPFTFDEKFAMMTLTGIPSNKIIKVVQNYNLTNLVGKIPIDINRDSIIFAVSEKDMAEDPRFSKFTKKDGSPTYLQPLPKKLERLEPAIKHGYIDTVPTIDFTVLGKPARSASELRSLYGSLNTNARKLFIKDLFGAFDQTIFDIMNLKLNPLTESQKNKIKRIIAMIMKEDSGRVKTATHKTNLALVNQRKEEKRDAEEKLRLSKEKLNSLTSPEEKDSAQDSVDKEEDNVKSKDELLKAALQQAKS